MSEETVQTIKVMQGKEIGDLHIVTEAFPEKILEFLAISNLPWSFEEDD